MFIDGIPHLLTDSGCYVPDYSQPGVAEAVKRSVDAAYFIAESPRMPVLALAEFNRRNIDLSAAIRDARTACDDAMRDIQRASDEAVAQLTAPLP
jgi:hypothetical protein